VGSALRVEILLIPCNILEGIRHLFSRTAGYLRPWVGGLAGAVFPGKLLSFREKWHVSGLNAPVFRQEWESVDSGDVDSGVSGMSSFSAFLSPPA